MKLGSAQTLPDWRTIDVAVARAMRADGFRGSQPFIDRPLEATPEQVQRLRQAFVEADLEVCQINGWYEALCGADDGVRAAGVQGAQALVRIGRAVDARSVYIRPGGMNPRGHWHPHPDNHAPATFDRLVDSLRQICAVAEGEGVPLAIEGHTVSPVDSARRMREVIDAVGSPALMFNLDPVNFMSTVQDVYHTDRVLNELATTLRDRILVAHVKDVIVEERHVVHLQEAIPGDGMLDFPLFMRLFESIQPNGYFIIEHLPLDKAIKARDFVVPLARKLGIPLEQ